MKDSIISELGHRHGPHDPVHFSLQIGICDVSPNGKEYSAVVNKDPVTGRFQLKHLNIKTAEGNLAAYAADMVCFGR